jgi:hypothetical protein
MTAVAERMSRQVLAAGPDAQVADLAPQGV